MKPLDRIVGTNGGQKMQGEEGRGERVGIFFSEPLIVENLKYFSVQIPPQIPSRSIVSPSLPLYAISRTIKLTKRNIKLNYARCEWIVRFVFPDAIRCVKRKIFGRYSSLRFSGNSPRTV